MPTVSKGNRPIKKYQRTHSSSKNASDTFAEYITLSVVSGTSDSTIASVVRNAFAPLSFLQFPRVEILSELDFAFDHAIIARVGTEKGGSSFLGAIMDLLLPQRVVDSFRRIAKALKGYTRPTVRLT